MGPNNLSPSARDCKGPYNTSAHVVNITYTNVRSSLTKEPSSSKTVTINKNHALSITTRREVWANKFIESDSTAVHRVTLKVVTESIDSPKKEKRPKPKSRGIREVA